MWILFGAASKKKPIPGGAQQQRWCQECRAQRTFVECDIEDKIDVFFIPVLQGKTRGLVCCECGDDVDVAPVRVKRSFSEKEKDAMLAALKKRMST